MDEMRILRAIVTDSDEENNVNAKRDAVADADADVRLPPDMCTAGEDILFKQPDDWGLLL